MRRAVVFDFTLFLKISLYCLTFFTTCTQFKNITKILKIKKSRRFFWRYFIRHRHTADSQLKFTHSFHCFSISNFLNSGEQNLEEEKLNINFSEGCHYQEGDNTKLLKHFLQTIPKNLIWISMFTDSNHFILILFKVCGCCSFCNI